MTLMSANSGTEQASLPGGLYNAVWGLVAAVCRPAVWLDRWRGKRGGWLEGKLGLQPAAPAGPRCWIHACSVGEVAVALRCMDALRTARPELLFTLTTVTPEGHRLASAHVSAPDAVEWFPFDARGVMRRAFDRLRPEFVLLIEVELWPNHLREAQARGIPTFVVNARLTAREAGRYRLAGKFMRQVFALPRLVCAQTAEDAERFAALGARNVVAAGNLKFDPPTATAPASPRGRTHDLILLGASTHEGEERILLDVLASARQQFPDLRLILAPRHPQRAQPIADMVRRERLTVSLLSANNEEGESDCLVVDTIGDLPRIFARATVAFIGKSLTARGGQNFLEAVEAGCPVVFGPHMENFAEAADIFLLDDAVRQIANPEELGVMVARLLGDAEDRNAIANRATGLLRQHQGATRRSIDLVLGSLSGQPTFTDHQQHGNNQPQ
jgi:3-deoxy-D-manno-octulosonic-acid transferase